MLDVALSFYPQIFYGKRVKFKLIFFVVVCQICLRAVKRKHAVFKFETSLFLLFEFYHGDVIVAVKFNRKNRA